MPTLGKKASMEKRRYTVVIIHGVAYYNTSMAQWEKELQEDNEYLHPDLKIASLRWKRPKQIEKFGRGPLIIETETERETDTLIEYGIILRTQRMNCLKYQAAWDFKQCFNCKGFGHVAPHCTKEVRCGRCVGSHPTKDCPVKGLPPFCTNCRKRGHDVESRACSAATSYWERLPAMRYNDSGQKKQISNDEQLRPASIPFVTLVELSRNSEPQVEEQQAWKSQSQRLQESKSEPTKNNGD